LDECRRLLDECGLAVVEDYSTIGSYRPFREDEREALADDPRYAVTYCCVAEKRAEGGAEQLLNDFNLSLED
jgi:hypothetical protein